MSAIWSRFNSVMLVLVFLVLLAVLAMLAADARGGPLDPPAPPASTNSVKLPGTPISQPASFPIVINQPGFYYFTSNIHGVANQPGIVITSDNVTLDLMGFTLDGPDGFDQQGGIDNQFVPVKAVTIRNGIIRDWGGAIGLGTSERSNLYDLQIVENHVYGVDIGTGGIMERLVVSNNSGLYGITVYQSSQPTVPAATVLRNSIISFNEGAGVIINDANGVWIHHNYLTANTSDGVRLAGNASSNAITDNRFFTNGGHDVDIGNPGVNQITMLANAVVRNLGANVYNGGVSTQWGAGGSAANATNPWSNLLAP